MGLLAAFVVEIGPDLNRLRLFLYNVGAIAIIVAVHRRQSPSAPRLAILGAVPALVASACFLVMTLMAAGRTQPFAGDFGFVYFVANVALWLGDAAFGLVALRLGVVRRWGPLALAIGSLVAIVGIDRIGLTSSSDPTIFGPIALVGIALNGIGWILLGVEVVTGNEE